MSSKSFVLYQRTYCHLCEDMLAALERLRGEFVFTVTLVDVDSDAQLERQYDELVPVLTLNDSYLCHYFFDEAKVRAALMT